MKKLIVNKTPLNGYMEEAYALSVAVSSSRSYEWIYSNYIQLVFQDPRRFENQPLKFFKLSCKTGYVWDAECPLLNYDSVKETILTKLGINIIDFICNAIDDNCYVSVYLDEYYLSYRPPFGKRHCIHENLFTGYNLDEHILYGLAYVTDETGSFKEFEVNINEVINASQAKNYDGELHDRISLLSVNPEKFYEFDLEVVKNEVYDYIKANSSDKKFNSINNPITNYIFGIDVYDELVKYYEINLEEVNIIPLHIIYEHKVLMSQRIKYMIDNNYINCDDKLIEEVDNIVNVARVCKNICLKYFLVKNNKNLYSLIQHLTTLKERDLVFMQHLYTQIKCSLNNKEDKFFYSRNGLWFDVAYNLQSRLTDTFEVTFSLHILNETSNGYIKLSNEDIVKRYVAPITFIVNSEKGYFCIENNGEKEIFDDISCKPQNAYVVNFLVDLNQRIYTVSIKSDTEKAEYKNINITGTEAIEYIDNIVLIHENSYRYAITDVKCVVV